MLCSIPTDKSPSSNNWLDRLRSSRGFPAATGVDLDHALYNFADSAPSDPADIAPKSDCRDSSNAIEPKSATNRAGTCAEAPSENGGGRNWLGIMSSVIAELFIMGGDSSESRKASQIGTRVRSSRKQRNPKICAVSKPPLGSEGHGELLVRGEVGAAGAGTPPPVPANTRAEQRDNAGCEDGERDEWCHEDLKAFSRSEVTVIDTSCASWKFDKMLFRRKNVWRVREKKCKGAGAGRKKRKVSSCHDQNVGILGASKEPMLEECTAPPSHVEQRQQDEERVEEASRSADVNQVPNKRRFSISRPPRNLRK